MPCVSADDPLNQILPRQSPEALQRSMAPIREWLPGSFPPWWARRRRSRRWRVRPCWGRSSGASLWRERSAAGRSASLEERGRHVSSHCSSVLLLLFCPCYRSFFSRQNKNNSQLSASRNKHIGVWSFFQRNTTQFCLWWNWHKPALTHININKIDIHLQWRPNTGVVKPLQAVMKLKYAFTTSQDPN